MKEKKLKRLKDGKKQAVIPVMKAVSIVNSSDSHQYGQPRHRGLGTEKSWSKARV